VTCDIADGMASADRAASRIWSTFAKRTGIGWSASWLAEGDGKTLVVHGASQGGYQAIVTAALSPAVTALAANVPAGCDHTGAQAGREPGWPNWAGQTWTGRDGKKMLAAARYYDAMNFAARVKCPALVGVGLVDTVCPAEGVLAMCNRLGGPKEVVIMPLADHSGDHKAYSARFTRFLAEQKARGGR